MAWGLLALGFGFLYGWLTPGQADKSQILKTGLVYGLIIGLVLALLGWAIGSNPILLGYGADVIGTVVAVVVLTILFVVGVWLGDLVEGHNAHSST